MTNQEFNQLIRSLPKVEKVIGHTASGAAIVASVHSISGDTK